MAENTAFLYGLLNEYEYSIFRLRKDHGLPEDVAEELTHRPVKKALQTLYDRIKDDVFYSQAAHDILIALRYINPLNREMDRRTAWIPLMLDIAAEYYLKASR